MKAVALVTGTLSGIGLFTAVQLAQDGAYCAAKFTVEGFMESLAPVTRRLGIHVSRRTRSREHRVRIHGRTIAGRKYVDLTGDSILAMTGARLG